MDEGTLPGHLSEGLLHPEGGKPTIHKAALMWNVPSAAARGAAAMGAAAVSRVGEWLAPGTHPVPATGTQIGRV